MEENVVKRNSLFIILIGITGFSFGLLDWDSVISDLIYIRFDSKLLVSIISANIGTVRLIATLLCIKINDSKRPNYIFKNCIIFCAIGAIITSIIYNMNIIALFAIVYLLEVLILEIFSTYHYAYAYNSLPEERATIVHSRRISVFKITFMIGIALAGYISTKFINNSFTIISILSASIFILCINFVNQVKNEPKIKDKNTISLREKLNLRKYSSFYRKWLLSRVLGRFSLASIIVILSVYAIDSNLNLEIIKIVKSLLWGLSAIGFLLSGYLIKKNLIVKGDVITKSLTLVLLPFILYYPSLVFVLLLIDGISNPFNTMSNFYMLKRDNDDINIAQKELVINLMGNIAKMLSAYILININLILAIILIVVFLSISIILEIYLYIKTKECQCL